MEEYKIECYITKKNSTSVLFENYFSDRKTYDKWAKETEERALSEFYNKKIRIVARNT
ncbi:MAG: hypothetical protein SOZ34_01080 [Clostridia bacterium]|nr:hypothetical protein [Clostridia bacterium]